MIGAVNQPAIGNPETLTTVAKIPLVDAMNELDGDIGDLSSLDTVYQSDLVGAINEIDGRISEIVAQSGDDITEIVDARGGYVALNDRLDDLVVAPGLVGNQVVNGGTGTTGTLTLRGTSNATKTNSVVILQDDGGKVGIGTTAPTGVLEIKDTNPAFKVVGENGLTDYVEIAMVVSEAGDRTYGGYFLIKPTTANLQWVKRRNLVDTVELTIANSGNHVGIGPNATDPGNLNGTVFGSVGLHVAGSGSGMYIAVDDSNISGILINNSGKAANSRLWGIVTNNSDSRLDIASMSDAASPTPRFTMLRTGETGFGTTAPTALIHANQVSLTGAMPVLKLRQADVDQPFLHLIGESGTTSGRNLVDAADLPTPGAIVGWMRIYVEDEQDTNPITDGTYFVPFYAAPTS